MKNNLKSLGFFSGRVFSTAYFLLSLVSSLQSPAAWALTDTYHQSFDDLTNGSTVNNQDAFTVPAGDPDNAMIESGETSTGGGKALKLIGAAIPVNVARPAAQLFICTETFLSKIYCLSRAE